MNSREREAAENAAIGGGRGDARWPVVLLLVSLCLGVAFRVSRLDRKLYWSDETTTSFRLSGHDVDDVTQLARAGPFRLSDLREFQEPEKAGFLDAMHAIAAHGRPPLHYMIARAWAGVFGWSPAALRSLSAVFGILVIPAMWWLASAMRWSGPARVIATSLVAVSPIFVHYARESREYALFSLLVVMSFAALLHAFAAGTFRSWVLYTVITTGLLYTSLFALLVVPAHAVIAWRSATSCRRPAYRSLGVAVLVFLPWLAVLAFVSTTNLETVSHLATRVPIKNRIVIQVSQLSALFFDPSRVVRQSVVKQPALFAVRSIVALLIAVGTAAAMTDRKARTVIVSTIVCTVLPLLCLDAVTGGQLTLNPRYLFPLWTAVILAVALSLGMLIEQPSPLVRLGGLILLAGVISAASWSDVRSIQSRVWWHQWESFNNETFARRLQDSRRPVLIVFNDGSAEANLTSLARFTGWSSHVTVFLDPRSWPELDHRREVFVIDADETRRRAFEQRYGARLSAEDERGHVWRAVFP